MGKVLARIGVSGSVIQMCIVLIAILDRASTHLLMSDRSSHGPLRAILAVKDVGCDGICAN